MLKLSNIERLFEGYSLARDLIEKSGDRRIDESIAHEMGATLYILSHPVKYHRFVESKLTSNS